MIIKLLKNRAFQIIISILLGLGLSALFRRVCKDNNCIAFYAPPLEKFKEKIYKNNSKCVKYVPIATKCSLGAKTITFE